MPPTVKSAYSQLEDVVGCKWSVSVLRAVADGVSRPGALERHVQGIEIKSILVYAESEASFFKRRDFVVQADCLAPEFHL